MNTFTGGPSGGQIPTEGLEKTIMWIVTVAAAVTLLIGAAVKVKQIRSGVQQSHSSPALQEGDFVANTTTWVGRSCYDPTKRLDFWCKTDNVALLIRVDGQDDKIVPVYAANWRRGSHLELPDFNVLEVKVAPGQIGANGKELSSATIHWVLRPSGP